MVNHWLQNLYKRYCAVVEWNIGVMEMSPPALEALVLHGRLSRVHWCPRLAPLASRADPFIWPIDGQPRVIYEDIDRWHKRGRIRSISLGRFSRWQRSRLEIDRPFHLSYPFILFHESSWCCVPESARDEGVDLHMWDPVSASWRFRRRLIDGVGILDPTLFSHAGIWYLFGTTRGDGSYEKLRIWWADSLEGPWNMHKNNPAKADIRSARPAGPLFIFSGHWYRPAQDCTGGYGGAITINKIEILSPTEFVETTVSRVAPEPDGPYPHGLHTLSILGDKALIDGKKVTSSAWLPVINVLRRISKAARA
jgi:hypothetical protein